MDLFVRSSGVIAIAAGALNVLSAMPRQVPERAMPWVRRSADIAALIGLIGLFLFLRHAIGSLGLVGFLVASGGVVMLLASCRYEIAVSVYALGLLLLALAALQAGSFPRWIPILWILAPLIAMPGSYFSDLRDRLSTLAAIAYGAGFVGAGWILITKG